MAEDDAEAIDALYALDPSDFTAARNALVKQLKAEKRKDDAAVVAALRRPSSAAWALNQVAREVPALVTAALDAGARLSEASSGDPAAFRAATADERVAVAALVKAAARKLGSGPTPGALAATVHAAELDDAVADQLRRGVLDTDHQRTGLGFGFGLGDDGGSPVPPRAAKQAPKPRALRSVPTGKDAGPVADGAARKEAEAAAAAEQAAREAQEAARRDAEAERRRQLVQLQDRLARARKKAERLDQEATRAEATAVECRAQADAAAADVADLTQALADLDT